MGRFVCGKDTLRMLCHCRASICVPWNPSQIKIVLRIMLRECWCGKHTFILVSGKTELFTIEYIEKVEDRLRFFCGYNREKLLRKF